MFGDITQASQIYITCGYTDMRKSIDGLVMLIKQHWALNPFQSSLFSFCGRRRDRMKALLWEGDGFVLLYKQLENGRFQWPHSVEAVRTITPQQLHWLLEGLRMDHFKAVQKWILRPGFRVGKCC